MPGTHYRGLAAKFADGHFAWKVFGFNILFGLFVTTMIVLFTTPKVPINQLDATHDNKVDNSRKCDENLILWSEFSKHSCDNQNLWVIIDNKVYDMWPWGLFF